MRNHAVEFRIEKMAQVLGVCRSGYYQYLKKKRGKRLQENETLLEHIQAIYKDNRELYGSPRIHAELQKQGIHCSRKRVAKLMRKHGIEAKMRRKRKKVRQSSECEIAPNHLNQEFKAKNPNERWVSDITQVYTKEGWLYIAVVLDLFSRKIVGMNMAEKGEAQLVVGALRQALFQRGYPKEILHHSDRGCQYTSREFQEFANSNGIKLSMSGKGNCYDNAVVESFFHTLKTEHCAFHLYKVREEAKMSLFEYIEVFYNRKRIHSTNGYKSPEKYEKDWLKEQTSETSRASPL